MIARFARRRFTQFRLWWCAPTTKKDRVRGAIIGAGGFFWIGALGRIMIGSLPVDGSTVGAWALGSAIGGIVLGIVFPKIVSCLCFPFLTFEPTTS